MGLSYDSECNKCGAKVRVVERPMGVPGGKEKEQGYCPKCGDLVAEWMTDGFIDVHLIADVDRSKSSP